MPQPDFREFHSEELSNTAIAFHQSADNFVGSRVFPVVPVERQTAKYNVWDKNAFLRDEMQLRAPGDESAGSGFKVSQDTYNALVWALHKDLDNQNRANWTSRTSTPEESIARWLTTQGLQRRERQWVAKFFVTGVWGTSATPGNLWSDPTTSDPVSDVQTGKRTVLQNTGYEPNKLVVGYEVHQALVKNPTILARVTGGGTTERPSVVNARTLATIFEVDEYLVAKAVKATNVENETAAYGFIHGKHALLCYTDPNPGPEVPSAGMTFAWTGGDLMGAEIAISEISIPTRKAVRLEIEMAWDDKITASELGYFFESAVA